MLDFQGKYAEAVTEGRAVFPVCERVLGEDHPLTVLVRDNLEKLVARQQQ